MTKLTQINSEAPGSHRIALDRTSAAKSNRDEPDMFHSSEMKDELQALKGEVSRLLNTTGEGIFDASKSHAEALANQIKAALNELGETLSEQEDHVENIISDRPITSLASAFALGVVIGFMMRRH
jgi:ElaB/YqjD/DUF883 family membrane-anchored ribosome-binding protein